MLIKIHRFALHFKAYSEVNDQQIKQNIYWIFYWFAENDVPLAIVQNRELVMAKKLIQVLAV